MLTWPNLGAVIPARPSWYASAAYQARLVSLWVFCPNCVSPKYQPWFDQTRLKRTKNVRLGINRGYYGPLSVQ